MDLPTRSGPPAVEPHPAGCHLCGSTTGPLLPDPIAEQGQLICSRGCQTAPTTDAAAKDTRKGESTLSSDVLDLLAAIRDATGLPLPSTADADEIAWRNLMHRRLIDLHAVLSVSLSPEYVARLDPAELAADLRARTAAAPVTYTLWQPAALTAAEVDACTVCRRPFDPADTRWDGAARHRDTTYCRACVNRCHDTEIADHRCPICARGDR
ncbi:hypothetical protein [Actinacidiphila epipremni]|uniref:Uncharacterized protein n=1 Tax=Actinacidiphila epipremni TaxID=2053013 RepID=A0ABX0ZG60_9ACTN|nr:hypothetical protein [Actinacidiphila epipremni]NJP42291.1 hypothetical protein [Actinacidiphila epipremni]